MKTRKVLILSTLLLIEGGITAVIFNYMRAMDRTGIDFCLACDDITPALRAEFEGMGRVRVTHRRKKDPCRYVADLCRLLQEGFDTVHIHGNSSTMALEAVLARRYGVPRVIVHAHNTACNHPIAHRLLRPLMLGASDTRLACSEAAGSFCFGAATFIVLSNAIDVEHYRFDRAAREEVRDRYSLADRYVIGHVGKLNKQKNQAFLIEVLAQYREMDESAALVLVGGGSEEGALRERSGALGVESHVIWTGMLSDASRMYQAFDILVMPSLHEGLPLTLVEAQTAGLPCLISDTVTREVGFSDRAYYLSLGEGEERWAREISRIREAGHSRDDDMRPQVRSAGFDISLEAHRLREIYLGD